MQVTLISKPMVMDPMVYEHLGVEDVWPEDDDPDLIYEFAGRGCYKSWHKPNPDTQTNRDYLEKSIIRNGHYSVLEHGMFVFETTGVSRALLGELTRHRHLSFSVESLRFCAPRGYVVHPTVRVYWEYLKQEHEDACREATERYFRIYDFLTDQGVKRKQAREAARMYLPLMTETDLVVSGNARAWLDVLPKRLADDADREIQELAGLFRDELIKAAPNTFAHIAPVLV